jgi:prophage regulatory protein
MEDTVLRRAEVLARVGLSDATLRRLERVGRFPRRLKLSRRAVGWRERDIEKWLDRQAGSAGGGR